ncbi:Aste57867_22136 [Aphanomyces stellatus]|uniref:Aste57867_22136 protein n=1 Tax=Aphanomyces stellatus TaxID=120398 RepID=A0A485LJD2_9STRA|nr:hypothetical protein As57867_022067 [Aphanomyces stellatus]VFT98804.1 Aste57867_22136 [Aphanomyces stellatus]
MNVVFGSCELASLIIQYQDGMPGRLLPIAPIIRCPRCTDFDFTHAPVHYHDDKDADRKGATAGHYIERDVFPFHNSCGAPGVRVLLEYCPALVNGLIAAAAATGSVALLDSLHTAITSRWLPRHRLRFSRPRTSSVCLMTPQPLDLAAANGRMDAIRFLVSHAYPATTAAIGGAAAAGHLDVVQYLHHRPCYSRCSTTALEHAVRGGHFAVARYLVRHRLDPWTYLWHGIEQGRFTWDDVGMQAESIVFDGPLWIDTKSVTQTDDVTTRVYWRVVLPYAAGSVVVCRVNGHPLPCLGVNEIARLLRQTALPYRLEVLSTTSLVESTVEWLRGAFQDVADDHNAGDVDSQMDGGASAPFGIVLTLNPMRKRGATDAAAATIAQSGLAAISSRLQRRTSFVGSNLKPNMQDDMDSSSDEDISFSPSWVS